MNRPWIELCGHSYYYRGHRYKQLLTELREALATQEGKVEQPQP
jgi:hypothetical protein